MTSKELLLKDRELCDAARATVNANWFAKFIMYVRGAMMERSYTTEQLHGAREFHRHLMEITDPEVKDPDPLTSGLNHNLDTPKQEIKQTEIK